MKKLKMKASIFKQLNFVLAIILTTELGCLVSKLRLFDYFNERYKVQLIVTIIFIIPILFILALPHFDNSFKTRILKNYKSADMALRALCILPIIYFIIKLLLQMFSKYGNLSTKPLTLKPILQYELVPFLIFSIFCVIALVSINNNKHKAALYIFGIASILVEFIALFLSYEPYASRTILRFVIVFFLLTNFSVCRCPRTLFYYKDLDSDSKYKFEDGLLDTDDTSKHIIYAERKDNNLYEVINIISVKRYRMTLSINKAPAKLIHLTINKDDFKEHYEEARYLAEYDVLITAIPGYGI